MNYCLKMALTMKAIHHHCLLLNDMLLNSKFRETEIVYPADPRKPTMKMLTMILKAITPTIEFIPIKSFFYWNYDEVHAN